MGRVSVSKPTDLTIILIPVFASVTVVGVAFFMCVVAIFCRKAQQKDKRYDQLMLELEKLESSVARECKQGLLAHLARGWRGGRAGGIQSKQALSIYLYYWSECLGCCGLIVLCFLLLVVFDTFFTFPVYPVLPSLPLPFPLLLSSPPSSPPPLFF